MFAVDFDWFCVAPCGFFCSLLSGVVGLLRGCEGPLDWFRGGLKFSFCCGGWLVGDSGCEEAVCKVI